MGKVIEIAKYDGFRVKLMWLPRDDTTLPWIDQVDWWDVRELMHDPRIREAPRNLGYLDYMGLLTSKEALELNDRFAKRAPQWSKLCAAELSERLADDPRDTQFMAVWIYQCQSAQARSAGDRIADLIVENREREDQTPSCAEPPHLTVAQFAQRFPVRGGEVTVVSGAIPQLRALILGHTSGPWKNERVCVVDGPIAYAGPCFEDLIGDALSGKSVEECKDYLGIFAVALAGIGLAFLTTNAPLRALPRGHNIVVIEPDQFHGGFEALKQAAADTGIAVVTPMCETHPVDSNVRTFRIRVNYRTWKYPRPHILVMADGVENRVALRTGDERCE